MRRNTWYSPSKGKALTLAIVYLVLTLFGVYMSIGQQVPGCGCFTWLFFFIALAYFFTWLFKRESDQRIATQAQRQRYIEPDPDFGAPARPTTPGSSYIGLDLDEQFKPSGPPQGV